MPRLAETLADENVADPAFEGGVVEPSAEPMNDEPGRSPVVGQRQERGCVHVADERLVRRAKGFDVGTGVERVQLARERERIGEVVAAERTQVDAVRARDGEAAHGAVGIAELHYRPLNSGSRFSMKAAIPSFWSSEAKSR